MNLTMQVVEVAGRKVLVRWRVDELTVWQTQWLQVGDTLNLDKVGAVKLSWN